MKLTSKKLDDTKKQLKKTDGTKVGILLLVVLTLDYSEMSPNVSVTTCFTR